MNSKLPANQTEQVPNLHLPESATTRSGVVFHPTKDVWSFRDGVYDLRLNFRVFVEVSPQLLVSMKAALMWNMQRYSARYGQTLYDKMKSLLKFISANFGGTLELITFEHLASYRSVNTGTHEPYLSGLAAFLKRWSTLGYPGIAHSAIQYLSQAKLKGYEKGVAVRTMDPIMGPLTMLEAEALMAALSDALGKGDIDIQGYLNRPGFRGGRLV